MVFYGRRVWILKSLNFLPSFLHQCLFHREQLGKNVSINTELERNACWKSASKELFMASKRVLCCFKNLKVNPNGPRILAENLNKVLNTSTFDVIKEWGAKENECKLECSADEVDYIRQHLLDLVTSCHRSIWFSYASKASDHALEFNPSRNSTQKRWEALYNLGSMIGYDRFIGHVLSNRSPVSVKIHQDTGGRLKSIILDICHTKYRMIFDMNLFHTDVLTNYGQDQGGNAIRTFSGIQSHFHSFSIAIICFYRLEYGNSKRRHLNIDEIELGQCYTTVFIISYLI